MKANEFDQRSLFTRYRSFLWICLIPAVTFLTSCDKRSDLLFFAENYWWDFLGDEFHSGLERLSRSKKLDLTLVISEWANADGHLGTFSFQGFSMVVLSPLMTRPVLDIARENRDTLFLILGDVPSLKDSIPSNLMLVSFDRMGAYHEAGRLTGDAAVDRIKEPHHKCGILIDSVSDTVRKEADAFANGFIEQAGQHLLQREVIDRNDRVGARNMIHDMRAAGVEFFLLRTTKLTDYCLDILQRTGGLAIIDDWSRASYSTNVFLSVEEDYLRSLEDSFLFIKDNEISWKENRMDGTVRLLRNIEQGEPPEESASDE